jgi:hypothetical protein
MLKKNTYIIHIQANETDCLGHPHSHTYIIHIYIIYLYKYVYMYICIYIYVYMYIYLAWDATREVGRALCDGTVMQKKRCGAMID